jgi:hypothetical protein
MNDHMPMKQLHVEPLLEKIAKDNRCYIAHLDTLDFQAKDFFMK